MDADHENCPLTDALMDTVDALVVIVDPDGRILQFNRACEAVTGFSADEVVGRSVVDTLIPIEEREAVSAVLDRLATPGTQRFENDWLTADGRRRRIAWSNATMNDPSGRVNAVIATGIDVTDQKRLESRLAQADRLDLVGRLAADMAHNFNNALTGLSLRVDRLIARGLDGDSRTDLGAIEHTICRAQDLITELLSFSSPRRPMPTRVDIHDEIERMRGVIVGVLGDEVAVELDLDADRATVLIDPVGFEQVLTNLVINARDAMPDGGRVTIATTIAPGSTAGVLSPGGLDADDILRLSVTDTGIGIHPDDVARVFDPYFTTKSTGRGTGLGLSTTYATVTHSGGAITVESEPGRGARFDVWFPLAASRQEPESVARSSGRAGRSAEAHVALVVDDDVEVCRAVADELRRLGCDTITAATGDEALQHLDAWIDLLLIDVHLPDIDGPEIAARFVRHRPELAVVFASGAPSDRITDLLPDDAIFMRKPFTAADLVAAIRATGHRVRPLLAAT